MRPLVFPLARQFRNESKAHHCTIYSKLLRSAPKKPLRKLPLIFGHSSVADISAIPRRNAIPPNFSIAVRSPTPSAAEV